MKGQQHHQRHEDEDEDEEQLEEDEHHQTKPRPPPPPRQPGRSKTKTIKKRTCSAERCSEDVMDRLKNTIVLCRAHRREAKGVCVVGHDTPVKWCTHCKKAHNISEFAFSLIGPRRKLSCCEKARSTRRSTQVNKVPTPTSSTTSSEAKPTKIAHHYSQPYNDGDDDGPGQQTVLLAASGATAAGRAGDIFSANSAPSLSMPMINTVASHPPPLLDTIVHRHPRIVCQEEIQAEFDDVLFGEMLEIIDLGPVHTAVSGDVWTTEEGWRI